MPAPLTDSTDELKRLMKDLTPYFNYFQIDITDGIFVPSKTLTIQQVSQVLTSLHPDLKKNLMFDFDLMVDDFNSAIQSLLELQKTINIKNIFIHISALRNQPIPNREEFTIGVAIDTFDDLTALSGYYDINSISVIQIMTVVPGFQGSPFQEKELNKIDWLRNNGYRNDIFIDGGVNDKTIPRILSRANKPDFAGIGSFLTKAPNIKERVEYLKNVLR